LRNGDDGIRRSFGMCDGGEAHVFSPPDLNIAGRNEAAR
jgi:hypothetical protein